MPGFGGELACEEAATNLYYRPGACLRLVFVAGPRPRPSPNLPTTIVSVVIVMRRWSTARKCMETHSRRRFTAPCSPASIATLTIKSLPHDSGLAKPTCVTCHADEQKTYDNGVHGKALAAGIAKAANCESCHGNIHEILPASDPKSRTARINIPKMCGECHSQPIPGMAGKPALAYQESVHGKLMAAGNNKAAVCSDCHGNHEILPSNDPLRRSSAATCQRPALSATPVTGPICQQCSRQRSSRWQYPGSGLHRLPWRPHHPGHQ